jgi:purine-binding chemotaxis protein CheW
MQPTSVRADVHARVLLGCFRAAGGTVAIEVAQLRGIVRHATPTPLPGAPAEIEGVIDLRGRLVPVVDLGRALGGEPVRPGPRARIAIAELDGLWLGLAVDAALEILAVPASALCDPPALVAQAGCETTRSVVRRREAPPLPVLSLEHLLERLYRTALSEGVQEDA